MKFLKNEADLEIEATIEKANQKLKMFGMPKMFTGTLIFNEQETEKMGSCRRIKVGQNWYRSSINRVKFGDYGEIPTITIYIEELSDYISMSSGPLSIIRKAQEFAKEQRGTPVGVYFKALGNKIFSINGLNSIIRDLMFISGIEYIGIDIPKSRITNLEKVFCGLEKYSVEPYKPARIVLDISKLNTEKCTSMRDMFIGSSITSIIGYDDLDMSGIESQKNGLYWHTEIGKYVEKRKYLGALLL